MKIENSGNMNQEYKFREIMKNKNNKVIVVLDKYIYKILMILKLNVVDQMLIVPLSHKHKSKRTKSNTQNLLMYVLII